MKSIKSLALFVSLFATTSVFAAEPFAVGKYKVEDVTSSSVDRAGYELIVGSKVSNDITADVRIENLTADVGPTTNRVEGGLDTSIKLGSLSTSVRGAVGEKFIGSGKDHFTYYSIEPGVSVATVAGGPVLKLSYRYQDAFDTGRRDQTQAVRVGVEQPIGRFFLTGGFDRVRGDSDYDGYSVGIGTRF